MIATRTRSPIAIGALLVAGVMLAACDGSKPLIKRDNDAPGPFPAADRPVAHIVSSRWSNEEARDRLNEAGEVMDKAGITPGMTVADIGAGEGYYTIRTAARSAGASTTSRPARQPSSVKGSFTWRDSIA